MSCQQFREEIELTVGCSDASSTLRAHLEICAECRDYFEQLSALAAIVSDESSFDLTEAEQMRLISGIESGTVPARKTEIVSLRWVRYAGAAAVVVLSFVGVTGYMQGWFGGPRVGVDSLATVTLKSDTVAATDTTYSSTALVDEYLSGAVSSSDDLFLGASGSVLDSLSEDEVKYLETHFDAKDVL
jgi:predicted anti-sigma-YlaC factor YlaD